MSSSMNAGFYVGFIIAVLGFLVWFISMAMAGGMAFGWRGWRNLGAFFRDPARRFAQVVFVISVLVMIFGSLVTCTSLIVGDATQNRACRQACRASGWEKGRFRANPHIPLKRVKGGPGSKRHYACWCLRGDEWSPEPVTVPGPE